MDTLKIINNREYVSNKILENVKVYENSLNSYKECFEMLNTDEGEVYKTLLKGWSDILTEVSEEILRLYSAL